MKLEMRFIAPDARAESDTPTALVKDDKIIARVHHDYYAAMFCFAEDMRSLLVAITRTSCSVDGQGRHASSCPKCAAGKLLLQIDLEEARLLTSRPSSGDKRCRVSSRS